MSTLNQWSRVWAFDYHCKYHKFDDFMFSGYLRSYARDTILIVYKRGERRDFQLPIVLINIWIHRKIVYVFIIFYVLIVCGLFDFKVRSDQYFVSKDERVVGGSYKFILFCPIWTWSHLNLASAVIKWQRNYKINANVSTQNASTGVQMIHLDLCGRLKKFQGEGGYYFV